MAVRLSDLRAGRAFPPRNLPGTHFCYRLSRPQGHSAAGRIRSIEKPNDLIGIRSCDLPACSIVPQPTTLPRAPSEDLYISKYISNTSFLLKNISFSLNVVLRSQFHCHLWHTLVKWVRQFIPYLPFAMKLETCAQKGTVRYQLGKVKSSGGTWDLRLSVQWLWRVKYFWIWRYVKW
jgi:hypothetical protein